MDRNQPTTKFFQEDVVKRVNSPDGHTGIVIRCWHDAEEGQPSTGPTDVNVAKPLQRGEIGVSFLPLMSHDIHNEKDFILVDRTFQAGDLCKRAVEDVQSGVVTNVKVEGRLEHAISGEPVEGWAVTEELVVPVVADIGDYVLYDDWVGQVIESFDEATVELSTGELVQVPELSCHLTVGEKGGDIFPSPSGVRNILGFLMGQRPSNLDTVVAVKRTALAVCWLAINQKLDIADAQNRKRPPRFWSGKDLLKLIMVRSKPHHDMRLGDKVVLKDTVNLPTTKHGRACDPAGVIEVQTLVVKETRTTVDILWQDGTRETLNSKELIPYVNPDEYDCWPGDHVIWKSEDGQRNAIVQSVNAPDRTATILYPDGTTDVASVLELDPNGTTDLSQGLGVRRGEFVLVHREGTTNGLEKPRVPRIGEVEAWARENITNMDGRSGGWRNELAIIGTQIAGRRAAGAIEEYETKQPDIDIESLQWFGEVMEISLDGMVAVLHPGSVIATYPLERLTKLHDGLEQLQEDWLDDSYSEEEVWTMSQDGLWQPQSPHFADGDEWEEMSDDDNDFMVTDDTERVEDTPTAVSPSLETLSSSFRPVIVIETTPITSPDAGGGVGSIMHDYSAMSPPPTDVSNDATVDATVDDDNHDEGSAPTQWNRFDIFPSVPQDHAFYNTPPTPMSGPFFARVTREYRVLQSSLPDSIFVRVFEDRGDLLRSVIIGPENTPYEDAPFVIDWMLDSNFPHSPPRAHFLSWTNGNGRVHPNLYEDGKICLSILGTWAGDRNETWSAARSSLLQAFVSIQGLVLVKEPWFCEPAYEKLRGTEEGVVNSRLYNEKAYVLSRGFVRRALENPVGALQPEFNHIYYTKKRLEKVVRDASELIEKSKVTPDKSVTADRDLAVPRLSGGGIITLGRTLSKLQTLLDSQQRTMEIDTTV